MRAALSEGRLKVLSLISVALSLGAGPQAQALEQRVWTARYPLAPGDRLAVENVQGNILVEGWERPAMEITVTKTALSSESRLDDVRIAFEFGDRALRVRTVYPSDSGEPVRVDYLLRVPRRMRLDSLRTVEGDIRVRDIEGSVDARTLNGNIEQVNVAGRVVARTINGKIAVSLRALPSVAPALRLDTINGDIELILPAKANANLEVSTVGGRIEGHYVFVASRVPGDTTRRVRLGRGGVLVALRTVRGNIRVGQQEDHF